MHRPPAIVLKDVNVNSGNSNDNYADTYQSASATAKSVSGWWGGGDATASATNNADTIQQAGNGNSECWEGA